jgi:uncharacterized membrane protein YfcA
VIQSLTGSLGFKSKGVSSFPFNVYLGISASIGALLGAQIAIDLDPKIFKKIIAIIIVLTGVLIMIKPKSHLYQLPERLTGVYLLYAIIGFFFIGIYGGFINAGIGFIIILFLNNVNRLSLIKTNATKVALVFIYSLGALALFAWNDGVDWTIGIVLALGSAVGAWWSSRWSVDQEEGVIKTTLIIMVTAMSIKLWFF